MTESNSSNYSPFAARRGADRPVLGLVLISGSLLATIAILIYFGAWAASNRVEARSLNVGAEARGNAAWEEGLLFVCPLH